MHLLYMLARFFPLLALPLIFICVEFGRYFRRMRSPKQYVFLGAGGFLILLILLWLIFRGDINSDSWIRGMVSRR